MRIAGPSAAADRREDAEAITVCQREGGVVDRSPVEDREVHGTRLDPQFPQRIRKTGSVGELEIDRVAGTVRGPYCRQRRVQANLSG